RSIPAALRRLDGPLPDTVEVRGECYLPKAAFARINAEQDAKGKPRSANPRNAAAGAVRQLDPSITARRGLQTFMYQLEPPGPARSQGEVLELLGRPGFRGNPNAQAVTAAAIGDYLEHWREARHDLDYDTDGVVIKVDSLDHQ